MVSLEMKSLQMKKYLGRCRVPEKQKEVVVLSAGNFNSYLT
jgi:hypothetical protein